MSLMVLLLLLLLLLDSGATAAAVGAPGAVCSGASDESATVPRSSCLKVSISRCFALTIESVGEDARRVSYCGQNAVASRSPSYEQRVRIDQHHRRRERASERALAAATPTYGSVEATIDLDDDCTLYRCGTRWIIRHDGIRRCRSWWFVRYCSCRRPISVRQRNYRS